MIRSKQPLIVNPQLQVSEIVYFEILAGITDYVNKTRHFNIAMFVQKEIKPGEVVLVPAMKESMGTFKEGTFLALFGDLTFNQFESSKDTILANQIEFINGFQWSGEKTEEIVRFWDLTAADLEAVPEADILPIKF